MREMWWWVLVIVLLIIIFVLAAILFLTPSPSQAPIVSTSTPQAVATTSPLSNAPPTQPLHERVVVDFPQPNSHVGQSFTVSGQAPGPWYFESVFPIKVLDGSDNTIGSAQGEAEGQWTTDAQVPFTASVRLDTPYHGDATLVLLKDNPSGMPENDDSVSIPIIVQ